MWRISLRTSFGNSKNAISLRNLMPNTKKKVKKNVNSTYRTITYVAHVSSTSQQLAEAQLLVILYRQHVLRCERRRRHIMHHL